MAGYEIGRPMEVTATAYDACIHCCGKTDGITKTGTLAQPNRTIAVDPRVIPLGSTVYIQGMGVFLAEDTGRAIKGSRIDIFMESHRQAFNFGVKDLKIYILNEENTRM